ncbi:MAG: hypothetical protein U5K43_13240 [Halofilum sp. (in: g-proteobacteria)]|nr:hypothetical protein [Halofilum sp. (in: g-proteobacteria)]
MAPLAAAADAAAAAPRAAAGDAPLPALPPPSAPRSSRDRTGLAERRLEAARGVRVDALLDHHRLAAEQRVDALARLPEQLRQVVLDGLFRELAGELAAEDDVELAARHGPASRWAGRVPGPPGRIAPAPAWTGAPGGLDGP